MQQVQGCQNVIQSIDVMELRKLRVVEKVRELSANFTLRQVASIHQMSMPYLRELADKHSIEFLDNSGSRSKRISSELIAREKSHVRALAERSIARRTPVTSLDSEKITPVLAELARRRDNEETNSFIDYLRELGRTNTKAQATKIAGISPQFMRQMAYDHEIAFVDEPAVTEARADHENLNKLQSSLFRPSRSIPAATAQVMTRYMMDDTPDEL